MNLKVGGSKKGSIRKRKVPKLLNFRDLQKWLFTICGAYRSKDNITTHIHSLPCLAKY